MTKTVIVVQPLVQENEDDLKQRYLGLELLYIYKEPGYIKERKRHLKNNRPVGIDS